MNIPAPIERPTLVAIPVPAAVADPIPAAATPLPRVVPSRARPRHWGMLASFTVMVALPMAAAGWYLWERAADRYVSRIAFSVSNAETSSALDMLGGIAQLAGSSSSSDTDILYQFIQSQELVGAIDAAIDLRKIWSNGDPGLDPLFSYHPPGTIEDLMSYWPRMVKVYNDSGTGIINVEVQAFSAADAHQVATMIYDDSSQMINRLSAIAREDAIRYAREDRDEAVTQLKLAREAMTRFRNRTQIVDPAANIQNQMGLLLSLQAKLAEAQITRATLKDTAPPDDPRIVQADKLIQVIKQQIADERENLGIGKNAADVSSGNGFADLVGEYEPLAVDQQFAEESYTMAMGAYAAAVAEARRQTRYLAAHVRPTLAEAAEHPQKFTLLALVAMFSLMIWTILGLVYYSLRDRR